MPNREKVEKGSNRADDKHSKSKQKKTGRKEKSPVEGDASSRELDIVKTKDAEVPIRTRLDTKSERRSKKRKLEEVVDESSLKQEDLDSGSHVEKPSKRKKSDTIAQATDNEIAEVNENLPSSISETKHFKTKKPKKEKKHTKNNQDKGRQNGKAEKDAYENAEADVAVDDNIQRNSEANQLEESTEETSIAPVEGVREGSKQQSWDQGQSHKSRFIAFIGEFVHSGPLSRLPLTLNIFRSTPLHRYCRVGSKALRKNIAILHTPPDA
jgi:hypothetical protein